MVKEKFKQLIITKISNKFLLILISSIFLSFISSDKTIFDIFLHKLYKIQPNDIVILFLPTLSRFRLPLETPYIDLEWSSDLPSYRESSVNINSMIGNSAYASIAKDIPPIGNEELHKKRNKKSGIVEEASGDVQIEDENKGQRQQPKNNKNKKKKKK